MSARAFLDTNVLVYTDDRDAPRKQEAALDLIGRCRHGATGVLSTQVLQEYYVAATRKLGVAASVARRKVELFARFEVVLPGVDDVLAAIDLQRLHGLSFWDALVIRAAAAAGCATLYTEDLQHGRRFDGVTVVNPFRE
jgi:predicted nucleic acid-binding protein